MLKRVRKFGSIVSWAPMESIQKLIACQSIDVMRRVKSTVAFCGGFRDAELCGLQWIHVPEDGAPVPFIDIRQTVRPQSEEGKRHGAHAGGDHKPHDDQVEAQGT